MSQYGFEITNVSFETASGFWFKADVHQNILAFSLFANNVGKFTTAPNIHFIHAAASVSYPTGDAFDHTFKCCFVQFWLDNTNKFIVAHEGFSSFPWDCSSSNRRSVWSGKARIQTYQFQTGFSLSRMWKIGRVIIKIKLK